MAYLRCRAEFEVLTKRYAALDKKLVTLEAKHEERFSATDKDMNKLRQTLGHMADTLREEVDSVWSHYAEVSTMTSGNKEVRSRLKLAFLHCMRKVIKCCR